MASSITSVPVPLSVAPVAACHESRWALIKHVLVGQLGPAHLGDHVELRHLAQRRAPERPRGRAARCPTLPAGPVARSPRTTRPGRRRARCRCRTPCWRPTRRTTASPACLRRLPLPRSCSPVARAAERRPSRWRPLPPGGTDAASPGARWSPAGRWPLAPGRRGTSARERPAARRLAVAAVASHVVQTASGARSVGRRHDGAFDGVRQSPGLQARISAVTSGWTRGAVISTCSAPVCQPFHVPYCSLRAGTPQSA